MDSGAPSSKEEVKQGIDTRTDAEKEKQESSTKDVKPTPPPLTVPQGQSRPRVAHTTSSSFAWDLVRIDVEIKQNLTLINRAVQNLEPRFTARVLRSLTTLRKKLYREALQEVVNDVYPKSQSPVSPSNSLRSTRV